MNKIAFLFTNVPNGKTFGREGLDAVLTAATLSQKISLFFIEEGVFQLITNQKPNIILACNYIVTFGMLSISNINECCICLDSLKLRCLINVNTWDINVKIIKTKKIKKIIFL